jgi:putative ABC transport system permease protein
MELRREIVSVAVQNLFREGVRTFLTLIGVIIGIAAIVSLLSIGNGLNNAVEQQFEQLGSNTILIIPGSAQLGFSRIKLSESDISSIENVSGIDSVVPIYSKSAIFSYNGEKVNVSVNAVDAKKSVIFDGTGFMEVEEGRMLENNDSGGILIGSNIAKDFFDREIHTKKKVLLDGIEYEVVGILKPQQASFGGGPSTGGTVYMSLEAYQRIVQNQSISPAIVFAKTFSSEEANTAADEITDLLEKKYGEKSVFVSSSEKLLEQVQTFLSLITIFVVGIGAVSMIVGGIGIMNAMITSVMERTREIGLLKALGASNNTVKTIFLLEAAFIGGIGGLAGIILGYIMSTIIALAGQAAGFNLLASYGLEITFGALIFSMIIGMLSGVLPAIKASQMDPVVALRYE